MASKLEKLLKAPALLVPFGQASDNCHLGNERLSRENLLRGKNVIKNLLHEIEQEQHSSSNVVPNNNNAAWISILELLFLFKVFFTSPSSGKNWEALLQTKIGKKLAAKAHQLCTGLGANKIVEVLPHIVMYLAFNTCILSCKHHRSLELSRNRSL